LSGYPILGFSVDSFSKAFFFVSGPIQLKPAIVSCIALMMLGEGQSAEESNHVASVFRTQEKPAKLISNPTWSFADIHTCSSTERLAVFA